MGPEEALWGFPSPHNPQKVLKRPRVQREPCGGGVQRHAALLGLRKPSGHDTSRGGVGFNYP